MIRLVLEEAVRLTAWGIGIGLLVALPIALVVGSVVELVRAIDPVAYAGAAIAVMAGSLAGAVIPSRRASRVDPLDAIRSD